MLTCLLKLTSHAELDKTISCTCLTLYIYNITNLKPMLFTLKGIDAIFTILLKNHTLLINSSHDGLQLKSLTNLAIQNRSNSGGSPINAWLRLWSMFGAGEAHNPYKCGKSRLKKKI